MGFAKNQLIGQDDFIAWLTDSGTDISTLAQFLDGVYRLIGVRDRGGPLAEFEPATGAWLFWILSNAGWGVSLSRAADRNYVATAPDGGKVTCIDGVLLEGDRRDLMFLPGEHVRRAAGGEAGVVVEIVRPGLPKVRFADGETGIYSPLSLVHAEPKTELAS